jgi:secreted Zn-dependent insulinase-like peptidase
MAESSHCGLAVIIQSARSPVHLELRINAFLSDFARILEAMELEKFESAKNGLITNLLEDYQNQTSE